MDKIVRSICQACHSECGVLVHVNKGKAIKVEGDPNHPVSKGFICLKGKVEPRRTYHSDRLKYPLRRMGERGEARWERISWDKALDEIAEKLTIIKERFGSESIAAIHGTGPRHAHLSSLIPHALGSPNSISVDLHICFAPAIVAERATIGHFITMESGPDYQNTNCILIFGGHPLVSHPPRGADIIEAHRRRKAKLIVVDPRKTQLASQADLWLQIRPGTDAALALGMMNVIINEQLYDKEFIDSWCCGFDKLCDRVSEYTPNKVAEITWIPADKIREAATIYATTKPAVLHRRVAIDQNINSTQTGRALINLVALTGNIDIKGGNLLTIGPEGYLPDDTLTGRKKLPRSILEKRIGSKEFPLISGPEANFIFPFVTSFLAFEAMATGKPYPIKALHCAGANPIINAQKSKWVLSVLKELDLLVVADFFMTPTAEIADYVLPATTWLERDDLCGVAYMNSISTRQKAIEPLYECWDDLKMAIELIKRIPWANKELVPWRSVDECNDWLVKGSGLTFNDVQRKGYIVAPFRYKKYEQTGFNTPSGKVELYSTTFEKYRYDPLPGFKEPLESPISTPNLTKDYPLILITGSRCIEYFCSEGRQVSQLRKRKPAPLIEIHPDAANEKNINDGDWVWIETPRVKNERVKLKAKLTTSLDPRVVSAQYGWWFPEKPGPEHGCFDSNINVVLSADSPREEICGSVPLRGTLCRIYKCI